MSGVLASMMAPGARRSWPFGWPPTVPYWADLEAPGAAGDGWGVIRRGLPLFSAGSAWVLATEWGPFFFGGLLLGLRDSRRRVIVGVFGVGFLLAIGLKFVGWNKSDLDRFLFYGTSAGIMLAAGWVEILEGARKRGVISSRWFRLAAVALVILPTILGPVGFGSRYAIYWILGRNSRLPTAFSDAELTRLRGSLAAVGPRDAVFTDALYAQKLVLAGFVVDAPLAPGFSIGIVDEAALAARTEPHLTRAKWLFLRVDDPRVSSGPAVVALDGYRLVRSSQGE